MFTAGWNMLKSVGKRNVTQADQFTPVNTESLASVVSEGPLSIEQLRGKSSLKVVHEVVL